MSECNLTLQLEKSDPVYRVGEMVRGTLHVFASNAVKCEPLSVTLGWFTHGRGNRDAKPTTKVDLFEGTLPAGNHSYPFELPVPGSPRTHHGEYLNVDFEVRATADIPWALDPSAEVYIAIVRDGDAGDFVVAPNANDKSSVEGCFPVAAGVALLSGIGLAFAMEQNMETVMIFTFMPFLLAVIGMMITVRRWMAEKKTGAVTVRLTQGSEGGYREKSEAGQLRCEVQLSKRGAKVNEATAKLRIRERVIKGSGTNKTTYKHPIHLDGVELTTTDEQLFVGVLKLPKRGEAPFPFESGSNFIEWLVEVHVDIAGWPDWKGELTLAVTPSSTPR